MYYYGDIIVKSCDASKMPFMKGTVIKLETKIYANAAFFGCYSNFDSISLCKKDEHGIQNRKQQKWCEIGSR